MKLLLIHTFESILFNFGFYKSKRENLKKKKWMSIFSNKWISLFFSCLVMITAGLHFLFPIFAPQLKSIFEFDQKQINLVGTLGKFHNAINFHSPHT